VPDKITWEEAVRWYCCQPGNEQAVLDNYFDDNVVDAAQRFSRSREFMETLALLPAPRNGRLLEIGAGRGIASYAFAVNGYMVTAMEPDPSNFVGAGAIRKLAQETTINISVIENVGELLPFDDACFDIVYVRQALHHAKDLYKFTSEIARVLTNNGLFIAAREHVIDHESDLTAFLDSHPLHHRYGGENAYTLNQYVHAINTGGLKLKRSIATFNSDINLYPSSQNELLIHFSQNFGFRLPLFFHNLLFSYYSATTKAPGRLYTFLAIKN